MLTIRLQRVGRKHEPTFRVVVTDSRTAAKKHRRFHEIVGAYDPRGKNETRLNAERIRHWIAHGVQPTGTVHNLLVTKKIIEGKNVNVLPSRNPVRPKKEEVAKEEAAPVAEVKEEKAAEAAPATAEEAPASPESVEPKEEQKAEEKAVETAPAAEEAPTSADNK